MDYRNPGPSGPRSALPVMCARRGRQSVMVSGRVSQFELGSLNMVSMANVCWHCSVRSLREEEAGLAGLQVQGGRGSVWRAVSH